MFDPIARATKKILDILDCPEEAEALRPGLYNAVKEGNEKALFIALKHYKQSVRQFFPRKWDILIEMYLCQETMARRQNWADLPPVEVPLFEGVTAKGRVTGVDSDGEVRIEFDEEVVLPEGQKWPSHFGCLGGIFKAQDVTFLG